MKVLCIRTDKPNAEIGLLENDGYLSQIEWYAHRELSNTLLTKIEDLLLSSSISYSDLDAVYVYKGPGSFTGLRIGVSVANAIAYSLSIPIYGGGGDEGWIEQCRSSREADNISKEYTFKTVAPEYDSPPHITKPRK